MQITHLPRVGPRLRLAMMIAAAILSAPFILVTIVARATAARR